ncbi:DUF596 domain-containing protein [Xylella fastidiosa]|uniref:DUF596 domain-containing protein n=1 Tax=Xylella fastidiosa subsp. fastidiosa TaxID=644356 RepID=A0AAJ5UIS9_XYLFS|nr:DUF596 domain-containing protein [Xylella fastidiosa]WCF28329.1 DUF596 domain-containing protein [Xylella fastidiosa subsp. fastidiosa]
MLTKEQIDEIYEDLGRPFHIMWSKINRAHGFRCDHIDPDSFEERKNDFLFLIGKLLDEGKLKLGDRKTELIMEGTTAELVEKFRSCFPVSDEEMLEGLWLVTEDCPFVAAWLFDGELESGEDYYGWTY